MTKTKTERPDLLEIAAMRVRWKEERAAGATGETFARWRVRVRAEVLDELLREALAIEEEDRRTCRAIGAAGAELIRDNMGVLTHCNAGGLATADYGTALAVLFTAHEQGRRFTVYADETRPLLQGARLTAG